MNRSGRTFAGKSWLVSLLMLAAGAQAATLTVNGTLTHSESSSSCTYTSLVEDSTGRWTVTCGTGTKLITINPRLCGSVCTSYLSLRGGLLGNWIVDGCVAAINADVLITQPAGPVTNHPLGTPLALAATASACSGSVAKVEFFANTTLINGCTVTTPTSGSTYQCTWTPQGGEGTYSVQAKATDTTGIVMPSQTVNLYVNAPPTATISATSPGSAASPPGPRAAPANFVLTGSGSDPAGIARVEFYSGSTLIGTVNGASGSINWNNVAAGTYSVTARAYDTPGMSANSTAITLTVASTNNTPTVTLAQPAASNAPVTLTATATDNDGTIARVEFVDVATNQVVATALAPTTPGGTTYTATWSNPSTGAHTIFARAVDNTGGATSTGNATFNVTEPFRFTLSSAPVSTPYFVAPASMKFVFTPTPTMLTAQTQITLYRNDVLQITYTLPASLTLNDEYSLTVAVPAGTHRFHARAAATNGSVGFSNDAIVTIDASNPPPAPSACSAESPAIGATAGAAAVGESGAGSYSIPIQVPPGIAGVAPSLSLTYSSQGGNGLVGVGWSLQGLSMIHRCPKSVFMDNAKAGITYTATDELCLDGQRLVPVRQVSGSDRNGTIEYRTDRESYSKIESFNPFSTATWVGPAYFKVSTKSGQILYYGWKQTEPGPPAQGPWDDAFIRTMPQEMAGKEVPRVWALYKIEDRSGNYAKIEYFKDDVAGTLRPKHIDYTGNYFFTAAGTYMQRTVPFAKVTFTYESRTALDIGSLYDGGGQNTTEANRLKTIVTTVDGVDVKRYTLNYGAQSSYTGRSLLRSVQECSGDGAMCLNATTFNWSDEDFAAHRFAFGTWSGASTGANRDTTVAVDMDGDGRTDLVSRADPQQTWDVCKAIGTNYACAQWISGARAQGNGRDDIFHFADFNGDGRADLVYLTPGSNGVTLQLSTGGGFGPAMTGFPAWPGYNNPSANPYAHTVGDFDGDGRAELALYMGNYYWTFCSFNGSSFACGPQVYIPGVEQPSNSPQAGFDFLVADLNGDGRADLAFHRNNSNQWGICHSTSQIGTIAFDCASASTESINDDAYRVHTADVNGDGMADMLAPDNVNGTVPGRWWVCLSRGDKTFSCSHWTGGPNVSHDNATLGDFNGDGRTDVAWYQPFVPSQPGDPVGWRVCESTGSSFNCNGGIWGAGIAPMDKVKNVRVGDFNGDGKSDLAIWTGESINTWTVGLASGSATDLMRRATNGMGIASEFTYKPLTDASVYAKGSSASYPVIDIQTPMYVVGRLQTSTLVASNPWYALDYTYRGLRGHAWGAGLFGFEGRAVVDANTDDPINKKMCTESTTFTSWPDRRIGLPQETVKRYGATPGVGTCTGGAILNQVVNIWESRKSNTFNGWTDAYSPPSQNFPIWEVFMTWSTEYKSDLNNASLPGTQMNTPMASIDALGNPKSTSTVTQRTGTDRFTKDTTSTYYNDVGPRWIIGRVTQTTATNSVPYSPVNANYSRVSQFSYNVMTGQLTSETIEPNGGALRLETNYGYDEFGNRAWVQVTGSGLHTNGRQTSTAYCVDGQSGMSCARDGRFPVVVQNAVGHTATRRFDARFGMVKQSADLNGLNTFSSYDRMGRKFCETRPDGSTTGWTWGASVVPGAAYFVGTKDSTSASEGFASEQHFDALNREVAVKTRAFDGRMATVTSGYDYRGRKTNASKPYGDATGSWTYAFDDLNRIKTEQGPAGYSATHTYDGMFEFTTLAAKVMGVDDTQMTSRRKNNRGEIDRVTDPRNGTLELQYDPSGNLEKKAVTAPDLSNAITTIYYNTRGQKTGMSDPDQGNWTYSYNAVGEMTQQIDGNNTTTTFIYDDIGRVSKRTIAGIEADWTYGRVGATCGTGSIGKLCRVADNKTSREHTYDDRGRESRTKVKLFDDRWFERFTTYDSMSRVRQIVYPITGLTLVHSYNTHGYANKIEEAGSTGTAVWTASSRYLDGKINGQSIHSLASTRTYDALGRVNSIKTPNVQDSSYTFDQLGNLTRRSDAVTGITETFKYDGLNRLKVVEGGPNPRTFDYDALGNLIGRSDIPGALQYYSGTHRLWKAGSLTYSYDPAGNMLSSMPTPQTFSRTISYWPSGKVSAVTLHDTSPPQGYLYEYDVDLQRSIESRMVGNTSASKTDYFFDGIAPSFEEDQDYDASGNRSLTWKHYVNTPEGVSKMVVIKNDPAKTRIDRAFVRDHLGSTMVVVFDGNPEYQSFDEWGRRRIVMGSPLPPTKTDRGFTGHEMMDTVGLINMNGRIYDPVLGRMMQADPLVQAPLDLQSYNRYSYVLNRPLSLTDPTGFSWWTKFRDQVVKPVAAAVVAYYTGGLVSSFVLESAAAAAETAAIAAGTAGDIYTAASISYSSIGTSGITYGTAAGAAGGAAGGFAAGGIMGGNLQSAVYGAASGGIGGGISGYFGATYPVQRVAANAVGGGISSSMRGEKFSDGFVSALLSSSLTYANWQMRKYQIDLTMKDPEGRSNGFGFSRGMLGDLFKLGGGRFDRWFRGPCSALGCDQKGPGSIFGMPYSSGSFTDMVVESFSGPHDHANMPWFYNDQGFIRELTSSQRFVGEWAGNYTTSLIFAAPFAVAAAREQSHLGLRSFK